MPLFRFSYSLRPAAPSLSASPWPSVHSRPLRILGPNLSSQTRSRASSSSAVASCRCTDCPAVPRAARWYASCGPASADHCGAPAPHGGAEHVRAPMHVRAPRLRNPRAQIHLTAVVLPHSRSGSFLPPREGGRARARACARACGRWRARLTLSPASARARPRFDRRLTTLFDQLFFDCGVVRGLAAPRTPQRLTAV